MHDRKALATKGVSDVSFIIADKAVSNSLVLPRGNEALWERMKSMAPENPAESRFSGVFARRLEGDINERVFVQAVIDVTKQHDMLRLYFQTNDVDPKVALAEEPDPSFTFMDLQSATQKEQESHIGRVAYEGRYYVFDLRRAPLWHVDLIRLSPGVHVLLITYSHVLLDGWSGGVLIDDLLAAYGRATTRRPQKMEARPSYEDIARWQEEALRRSPEELRSWANILAPLPRPLAFETRTLESGAELVSDDWIPFRLGPETQAQMNALALKVRATPYIVLESLYHVTFALFLGLERIVISSTTLGRAGGAVKHAIGQFTRDVFIPTTLDYGASLEMLVSDTRNAFKLASKSACAYKDAAAAVNPGFSQCRPWADLNMYDAYIQSDSPTATATRIHGLIALPLELDWHPDSSKPPVLQVGSIPESRLPLWMKHSAPHVNINTSRSGGTIVFNSTFFSQAYCIRLRDAFTKLAGAWLESPADPLKLVAADLL